MQQELHVTGFAELVRGDPVGLFVSVVRQFARFRRGREFFVVDELLDSSVRVLAGLQVVNPGDRH